MIKILAKIEILNSFTKKIRLDKAMLSHKK